MLNSHFKKTLFFVSVSPLCLNPILELPRYSDILTRGAAGVSLTDTMESVKRLAKLLSQEPTSSGTPKPAMTTDNSRGTGGACVLRQTMTHSGSQRAQHAQLSPYTRA